jgi:hypothetical protein
VAHPQIAAFARVAEGKAAPTRRIEGQDTLLARTMHAIEYDAIHDEIVVPNQLAQAILTFGGAAAGEEPPIRVIQGSRTQLRAPDRLALDPVNDEILVPEGDRILVFQRSANGDAAPIRVLHGPGPQRWAMAIDVDPIHDLLVISGRDEQGGHILIFDRKAEGNAKPRAAIRGPRTMFAKGGNNVKVYPEKGWILAVHDGIQPLEGAREALSGLSFVGVWSIHDTGDVAPRLTIGGPKGTLVKPRGLALDPKNRSVIVSDKDLNAVLTYHVPDVF